MVPETHEPVPAGRELVRARPEAGLLLRLVPQRGIGEPGVQWSGRSRPAWFDAGHQVLGGIDAGRDLDVSLRTHLAGGDPRALALAHLADRLRRTGEAPSGADPRWAPIRVEVDDRPVPAEQGVADGHELVVLRAAGRVVTVVTNVVDADRFTARYATFRPWFDRRGEEAQTREA